VGLVCQRCGRDYGSSDLTSEKDALPSAPCRACGPGYRIGDEGCRHDPYEPSSGETGICRTCALPIWWEQGTVGHQKIQGWSDRIEQGGDSLVCFQARNYRHQPMGRREEAIYRAGFKAGQVDRTSPPEGASDG
jgi:hypothetical protein